MKSEFVCHDVLLLSQHSCRLDDFREVKQVKTFFDKHFFIHKYFCFVLFESLLTLTAVSYTHLDVYKRQGFSGAGEGSVVLGSTTEMFGSGWSVSLCLEAARLRRFFA